MLSNFIVSALGNFCAQHGRTVSTQDNLTVQQPSITVFTSRPKSILYAPLSPYTDNDTYLSNNLLCPRYAENDNTSAPPSPASIESFDILDSVAWRQSHSSHHPRSGKVRACDAWRRNKSRIVSTILLTMLLAAGCALGGLFAWRHENMKITDTCLRRDGGDRCQKEITWAKCVASNGLGYCEGIMAK
jgi:hypothetical protein